MWRPVPAPSAGLANRGLRSGIGGKLEKMLEGPEGARMAAKRLKFAGSHSSSCVDRAAHPAGNRSQNMHRGAPGGAVVLDASQRDARHFLESAGAYRGAFDKGKGGVDETPQPRDMHVCTGARFRRVPGEM